MFLDSCLGKVEFSIEFGVKEYICICVFGCYLGFVIKLIKGYLFGNLGQCP